MKIQITTALAIAFVASFSLMSHSNGVAEEQNKDRTGAPGSSQPCTHCHSPAGSLNANSAILFSDDTGTPMTEYIPGDTYLVEFLVDAVGAAAYGFQATSIHGDGSNAGNFSSPGTNVQLEVVNGRHIVEQSDPLVSGSFTVEWTAPATGSGDVAFYMAGMAVNLAYGNTGDSHDEAVISLTEGVDGINDAEELSVSNPIVSYEGISWNAHKKGNLQVFGYDGKLKTQTTVVDGEMISIPTSDVGAGLHIINFTPTDLVSASPRTWKVVIPG